MKKEYFIAGYFYKDLPWEDFIPVNKKDPSIMITADTKSDEMEINGPDKDNWYDAKVRTLTREIAIEVIKKITGVDEVIITEKGQSLSV